MQEVAISFLAPILIGIYSCGLARLLDGAMSHGHILDFVRRGIADRVARRSNISEKYTAAKANIRNDTTLSFKQAADNTSIIQSNVARNSKLLTGLSCTDCMSGQIGIITSALTSIYLIQNGFTWCLCLAFIIFSGSAARLWNGIIK